MNYLVQVNLYWIALYACYALLLRRQTFLRWNRVYLLGSLAAAFALPLVQYPAAAPSMPVVYEMSAVTFTVAAAAVPAPSLLTWENLLWVLYSIGALVMLVRLIRHLHCLCVLVKSGDAVEMEEYTLILPENDRISSFSFLRWVVIGRVDYAQNFDTVLNHELVHVRQRHSVDILLVEALRVAFWFNPVLILYKNALQQVHEYLADQQAQADNRDGYAEFLLSYATKSPATILTNQFFIPKFLKNRITMLYKNKNSNWSLGKYAAVALFIGFTSLVVASCEREITPSAASGEQMVRGKINVTGIISTPDHKPFRGAILTDGEGKKLATTDAAGRFSLKIPAGESFKASAPGFGTMNLEVPPIYRNADYDVVLSSKDGRPGNLRVSPSADGKSVKVTVQTGEINGSSIFTVVENQPEFPGGNQELYKFLSNNIKYPEAAAKANVTGKVFVNFVVTTEGEIRDIQILKGIGFGADGEAVRVVKAMPRWKPGTQDGKAVNVRYNLPIAFQTEDKKLAQLAPPSPPRQIIFFNADKSTFQVPTGADEPIIVLDGVEVKNANPRPTFKTDEIKGILLRTGADAKKVYGEKGANGVIELSTKE